MMKVTVLPIEAMQRRKAEFDVIVTVLGPWDKAKPTYQVSPAKPEQKVIKVWMGDTDDPFGYTAPDIPQVKQVLDAMRPYAHTDTRVGVACEMGISRSSAMAYAILCLETEAVQSYNRLMKDKRSGAFRPNLLITWIADGLLEKGGAMVKAIGRHNGATRAFFNRLDYDTEE